MSEVPYNRIDPQEVSRQYATLVISPTERRYQVWMNDTMTHADPLGLLFYIEEGQITTEMGYQDLALALDLPIPYVIGFDIAWCGDDTETQVVASEVHEHFSFSLQDPDLWYGSADGSLCRQKILTARRQA